MKRFLLITIVVASLSLTLVTALAADEFTFHLYDENGQTVSLPDARLETWRLDIEIGIAKAELQPGECKDYEFYPNAAAWGIWTLHACRAGVVDPVDNGGTDSGSQNDSQSSKYQPPSVTTLFKLTKFALSAKVVAQTDTAYTLIEVKSDGVASLVVPYGTMDWEGTISVTANGKVVTEFSMTGPATQDDQAVWVDGTATRQCADPYTDKSPSCPAKPAG